MLPAVTPQLGGITGLCALRAVIVETERYAGEPKLGILARGFDIPLEVSPVVAPSRGSAMDMTYGRLEGIVLKDRTAPYRDGSRAGWYKVKDRGWYERESWRFER